MYVENVSIFVHERKTKQMGDIHEMKELLTCETWYETNGVKYDAFRMAFRELGLENFSKKRVLTSEELSRIESYPFRKKKNNRAAKQPAKKSQTVSTPTAKDKPEKTPAPSRFKWPTVSQVRTAIFDTTAIGVIVGHGFLIWQEAAELYGYIGAVGGFVVFLVVCLAVLLAADSGKNRTSEYALYFMLFVDAAAGFIHFEALSRPDVPQAMTIGFCIFICACSWVALLLYRDSKQD